jgi:hypothetical protein
MCAKCDDLTISIARYERVARQGLDSVTTKRIHAMIADLGLQRSMMHAADPAILNKREADGINRRSEWRVGQRVSRKDSVELGSVTEVNGKIKVKWDSGRTSVFNHGDKANVELTGRV